MPNLVSNFYEKIIKANDRTHSLIVPYHFNAGFTFADTNMSPNIQFVKNFAFQDIGYLIQNVSTPNWILSSDVESIVKPVGRWNLPNEGFVTIDKSKLTVDFLDTEVPIFENFFMPWMELVSSHTVATNNIAYSFPKANFYIDVYDNQHEKILYSYKCHNVFPFMIDARDFDQKKTDIQTRQVIFQMTDMEIIHK